MTKAARRAYGFSRVSVMKADLRRASRIAGRAIPVAWDLLPEPDAVFAELVSVYAAVSRGYPDLTPLVDALLARHELANVLLIVRQRLGSGPFRSGSVLWRSLGPMQSVSESTARECATLADLATLLSRTRLADIGELVREASAESLGSMSLAAERAVWAGVDRAFESLPRSEHGARAIGDLLVLEQDFDWLHRAPTAASLDPLAAARATVRLRSQLSDAELQRIVAWTPSRSALGAALPVRWWWMCDVPDWDGLTTRIRQRRRLLCERAFTADPFALAVPVAVLLLKEEEVRAVASAREARDTPSPLASRAQAGSLLGTS